jgi:hypothetical protein
MGFPTISVDGTAGGQVLAPSGTTTGHFYAVQALEASVLHGDTVGNVSDLNGVTISAGLTVFGRWTSIKVTSGKVLAYNAK